MSVEEVRLSTLKACDCGRLNGKRFIVIGRVPEDRSSGYTTVQWEEGGRQEFFTDAPTYDNPMVVPLGAGSWRIVIDFPADSQAEGENT